MKILQSRIRFAAFACFLSFMLYLSSSNIVNAGAVNVSSVQITTSELSKGETGEPVAVAVGFAVLVASAVVAVGAFGIGVVNGYVAAGKPKQAFLELEKNQYSPVDFTSFDI